MENKDNIDRLCTAIEKTFGRKMHSPKDFDQLSAYIFEQTHQTISPTTLKRIWGYLSEKSVPRLTTLDILTQAIGHTDWETFCQQENQSPEIAAPPPTPEEKKTPRKYILYAVLLSIPLILLATYLLLPAEKTGKELPSTSHYILKKGQTFKTPADYLRLFGITKAEQFWDEPLPHHEGIIIWGPEYRHKEWHNEGNADSLMPTITEWWTPAADEGRTDTSSLLRIKERNENLYFTVMRTNEVRITFMKNLTDTGYVFLGIYRTNLAQSDSSHIVWEREADECDLTNLDYLQQLRH